MAIPVGLSDLHYALLTKDDNTGITYGTVATIPNAINVKASGKSSKEVIYADNKVSERLSKFNEIEVEIEVKDLDYATQAILFGHTIAAGVMTQSEDDVQPDLALGFKIKKSNGKYRYVWLLKGQFDIPDSEGATEEDKPKPQTMKLKGLFLPRENDGKVKVTADEDDVAFLGASTWFDAVPTA